MTKNFIDKIKVGDKILVMRSYDKSNSFWYKKGEILKIIGKQDGSIQWEGKDYSFAAEDYTALDSDWIVLNSKNKEELVTILYG